MDNNKKDKGWERVLGALTTGVGIYIGKYIGLSFFIFFLGAVAFSWLLLKLDNTNPFLIAIAILGGQIATFVFVLIFAWPESYLVSIDLFLMLIGGFWLFLKAGAAPVIFLIAYQCTALITNTISIFFNVYDYTLLLTLLFYLLLKILFIIVLLLNYKTYKKLKDKKDLEKLKNEDS